MKIKKYACVILFIIISGLLLLKDPILSFAADFTMGVARPNQYYTSYDAEGDIQVLKNGETYSFHNLYDQWSQPMALIIFEVPNNESIGNSAYGFDNHITSETYSYNTNSYFYESSFTFEILPQYSQYEYWKITNKEYSYYDCLQLTIEPYTYIEPTFELVCNPGMIAQGEESNCSFKATTASNIKEVSFKIDSSDYTISNIKEGSNYTNIASSDGVYTVQQKDNVSEITQETEIEIASFKVKAEKDISDIQNNIKISNVSFRDIVGSSSMEDEVTTTIKKGINPSTGLMIFYGFIIIIGVLSLSIIIKYILNKKKLDSKI